nr:hypothetical protein Iba_scaffold17844CG1040 [Ipomoea batatas]
MKNYTRAGHGIKISHRQHDTRWLCLSIKFPSSSKFSFSASRIVICFENSIALIREIIFSDEKARTFVVCVSFALDYLDYLCLRCMRDNVYAYPS